MARPRRTFGPDWKKRNKGNILNAIVIHRRIRKWVVLKDVDRDDPTVILQIGHRRIGLASSHMPTKFGISDMNKTESLYIDLSQTISRHKHAWIIGIDTNANRPEPHNHYPKHINNNVSWPRFNTKTTYSQLTTT